MAVNHSLHLAVLLWNRFKDSAVHLDLYASPANDLHNFTHYCNSSAVASPLQHTHAHQQSDCNWKMLCCHSCS